MKSRKTILMAALAVSVTLHAKVKVILKTVCPQTEYAATRLHDLPGKATFRIEVSHTGSPEGFTVSRHGQTFVISGNDPAGAIYGANLARESYLNEQLTADETDKGTASRTKKSRKEQKWTVSSAPEMPMRGACVGLQKTEYLPGHKVYEYPYTPENFPWFYDKQLWLRYLDMLAENNMNTVYLWNGHPFASLVRLSDYPFAAEVDEATMQLNQEMFSFLTTEAARRGIRIIQMFYNIILSKPFADHYGLKTQDRNRPITPLIADYTRKSIAAFVEKYPEVGFLVCLGEAMATIDDDVQWMTQTIIPGIRDGLQASGRTDTPPIILRSHDTDGPLVLQKALPLYPNIYTMTKYTGESLTTYEPRGPWAETQQQLAAAAPVHISNVHILANLEPWRWSSPAFTQKAVNAMHRVHHASGLHLYPQASYWDWPYTADRLADGSRLLQIDRDWMWYKAWGRYAWNSQREADNDYWTRLLADHFGVDRQVAAHILNAYDESGEIAPKLIRRFGITEGNRQTLLLGMKMAQLVNPYKFTVYPGFYESCGPEGEKLIEYVEKKWKGERHRGELPLDIAAQCEAHGRQATTDIDLATPHVTRHQEEFSRIANDMHCYLAYAQAFRLKVLAAEKTLDYKWTKDLCHLDTAAALLGQSLDHWRQLVRLTRDSYLYANSMQTAQRRIPVGGDDGRFKTWAEMLPVYEEELAHLQAHIKRLKNPKNADETAEKRTAATRADVVVDYAGGPGSLEGGHARPASVALTKDALLFQGRQERVDSVAPELDGLSALVLNRDTTRIEGTAIRFASSEPVQLLVGFFQDDDPKWARPPKLETDATGNEYGQAEALLTNAINMTGMPPVNIHAYHFGAGSHTIHLPRGIIMVAGFTTTPLQPRDVGLQGAGDEVDWLFQK